MTKTRTNTNTSSFFKDTDNDKYKLPFMPFCIDKDQPDKDKKDKYKYRRKDKYRLPLSCLSAPPQSSSQTGGALPLGLWPPIQGCVAPSHSRDLYLHLPSCFYLYLYLHLFLHLPSRFYLYLNWFLYQLCQCATEIRFYLKDAPTVDNPAPVWCVTHWNILAKLFISNRKVFTKKIARTAHGPTSNLPSLALHAPTQNLTRVGPPRRDGRL